MSSTAMRIALVAVAVGALLAVGSAEATTISVNLRIGSNDSNSVDTDETAGAVPVSGTHWNNVTIAGGRGAPTSFYGTSFQLKDDAGNANAATLTSTLVNGDNSDANNDGHIEWRKATGTSMATANSANYARFAGLTASGFAIDLDADTGRGSLNGIQIVETPQVAEDAISINFMRSSSLDWTHLFSDEVVGVVPLPNWNNIDVADRHAFAPIALLDAKGNPTSATVASTIDPGYDGNNGNGNATSDRTMMNAALYYDNGVGTDTGNSPSPTCLTPSPSSVTTSTSTSSPTPATAT